MYSSFLEYKTIAIKSENLGKARAYLSSMSIPKQEK